MQVSGRLVTRYFSCSILHSMVLKTVFSQIWDYFHQDGLIQSGFQGEKWQLRIDDNWSFFKPIGI